MTLNQFRWIQGITAVLVAVILSQTLAIHNFNLAIIGGIAGALILRISRNNINEVVADERDSEIAGKAARFSIRLFSTLAVCIAFPLIYDGQTNHVYAIIGSTLAYSAVALLVLYNVALAFKKNSVSGWKRIGFIILIAVIAFGAEILATRIFGK